MNQIQLIIFWLLLGFVVDMNKLCGSLFMLHGYSIAWLRNSLTYRGSLSGSAICAYKLSDIENNFSTNQVVNVTTPVAQQDPTKVSIISYHQYTKSAILDPALCKVL